MMVGRARIAVAGEDHRMYYHDPTAPKRKDEERRARRKEQSSSKGSTSKGGAGSRTSKGGASTNFAPLKQQPQPLQKQQPQQRRPQQPQHCPHEKMDILSTLHNLAKVLEQNAGESSSNEDGEKKNPLDVFQLSSTFKRPQPKQKPQQQKKEKQNEPISVDLSSLSLLPTASVSPKSVAVTTTTTTMTIAQTTTTTTILSPRRSPIKSALRNSNSPKRVIPSSASLMAALPPPPPTSPSPSPRVRPAIMVTESTSSTYSAEAKKSYDLLRCNLAPFKKYPSPKKCIPHQPTTKNQQPQQRYSIIQFQEIPDVKIFRKTDLIVCPLYAREGTTTVQPVDLGKAYGRKSSRSRESRDREDGRSRDSSSSRDSHGLRRDTAKDRRSHSIDEREAARDRPSSSNTRTTSSSNDRHRERYSTRDSRGGSAVRENDSRENSRGRSSGNERSSSKSGKDRNSTSKDDRQRRSSIGSSSTEGSNSRSSSNRRTSSESLPSSHRTRSSSEPPLSSHLYKKKEIDQTTHASLSSSSSSSSSSSPTTAHLQPSSSQSSARRKKRSSSLVPSMNNHRQGEAMTTLSKTTNHPPPPVSYEIIHDELLIRKSPAAAAVPPTTPSTTPTSYRSSNNNNENHNNSELQQQQYTQNRVPQRQLYKSWSGITKAAIVAANSGNGAGGTRGSNKSSSSYNNNNPNRRPSWMVDEKLLKSKIFTKRLSTAATCIQSHLRGFVFRQRYPTLIASYILLKTRTKAAKSIQHSWSRYSRMLFIQKLLASIKIQKWVRRYVAQLKYQFQQLERQLDQSNTLKFQELQQIQIWKELEWKRMEQEIMEEQANEESHHKAQARLSMTILAELQDQNRLLQHQHDELQQSIQQANKETEQLLQQAQQFQSGSVAVAMELKQLHLEQSQYQEVLDHYELRIWEYQCAVEEREWHGMVEHSIKRNYETTLRQIKWTLESSLTTDHSNHSASDKEYHDECDEDEEFWEEDNEFWNEEEEERVNNYLFNENINNGKTIQDGFDWSENDNTAAGCTSSNNINAKVDDYDEDDADFDDYTETVFETYMELHQAGLFDSIKEHVKRQLPDTLTGLNGSNHRSTTTTKNNTKMVMSQQ